MVSLVLLLALVLSLFSGSLLLISLAVTALLVKLYPILLLAVIAATALWAFHNYYRK
jgi:hypothetical protein